MGTLRPDPRNSLPRVSGYLNAQLSSFAFFISNTMSPLPNLRECDDDELAKLPSDSEDTLAAKFAERMKRRREVRERKEREQRECEEREARERAEHEARDARERRSREERERSAREEVCRGKVSAQHLKQ